MLASYFGGLYLFRLSNGIKIAALFTAVILGAGFASGQELLRYFASFGPMGVAGLVLAGIIFALAGWATLDICRVNVITDYSGLMRHLLGERLAAIFEWLVAAFLLVLLAAMLAASGAAGAQSLGLPHTVGVAVMGALCLIVMLAGLQFLVNVNTVLAPLMVTAGIVLGLYTFFNRTVQAAAMPSAHTATGWLMAAVVYASYNMVTGVPVLASASRLVTSGKDARRGGVWGGGAMTLLGICMTLPLLVYYAQVKSVEIPFMVIIWQYGKYFSGLYLFLLVSAIFTTAVSNAYALSDWCCSRFPKAPRKSVALTVCLLGVAGAQLGFSNIVGYVYPAFGLLGVFQIAVVLLNWAGLRRVKRAAAGSPLR
jgi:uncharacterized membrane protein YkvI